MKSKLCAAAVLSLALTAMSCGSAFAAYNSRYFIDVNEGSYAWSADAVDSLLERGIVSGVGDNKYAPGNEIKRCDFVVLIDRAFKLTPFSDFVANFNDISSEDYYYTAVVNAKGAGIIKNDYAFYPQVPITRGDAMQMLYTALDKKGYITNATTDLSMYSDASDVRDINSQLALGTLTQMGIISGSDGKIMFTSTMSRAEMAMVFYKALEYMDTHKSNLATKTDVTKPVTDPETTEETDVEDTEDINVKDESVLSNIESKKAVVIDGTEVTGLENCKIHMTDSTVNSVEVSNGVDTDISGSLIQAMGVNANAVMLNRSASADIKTTNLYAGNNGASGVKGSESTKVVINGGKIVVDGKKATGIYTSGEASIDDAEFEIKSGSAVTAENSGEIVIDGIKVEAKDISYGVFYAATATGEPRGKAEITVKNSEITGDRKTTLFYASNNDLKATLENCTVDKVSKLVDCGSNYEARKSGSDVVINLVNQKITADVLCDDESRITINLKKGSHLIAGINSMDTAKYVEINVEEGSTLELVENSYIHLLNYDSVYDIHENGRVIYYDSDLVENSWLHDDDQLLENGGYMTPMD